MIKPDARFNRITDIKIDFLKKNKIEAIILDVDNTLIDLEKKEMIEKLVDSINDVKAAGIKLVISSNSIKKHKVSGVAKKLDIPYVYVSLKPLKRGLKKALKILKEEYNITERSNIAEIGDQVYTDVIGANRLKLFSILTTPIEMEKGPIARFKRRQEKKYLNKLYQG